MWDAWFTGAAELLYQVWPLMPLLFLADLTTFHVYTRTRSRDLTTSRKEERVKSPTDRAGDVRLITDPITNRDPGDENDARVAKEDRFLLDESEFRRRLDEARREGYAEGYDEGYLNGRDDALAGIIPGIDEAELVLNA